MFRPYTRQPFQNPYATAQAAAGRLADMPAPGNPYAQPDMRPVRPVSESQFANGRESADMHAMPPNPKTVPMDGTMARFHLKETDASGMARVTAYDFTPASDAPADEYATRGMHAIAAKAPAKNPDDRQAHILLDTAGRRMSREREIYGDVMPEPAGVSDFAPGARDCIRTGDEVRLHECPDVAHATIGEMHAASEGGCRECIGEWVRDLASVL